ncbi:MAG TPA: bifunctional DNA-formamidopyrimidine glycosylase/DNA-(apurinic or apyrimidinic site) lyase [Syntrophomonadaceae bacterium]|nr:bifunctional DNA-formamidopyrimidine glycosylase/DNA-(apurinic or apyrimidinic site) lyase [Syntrophomonadaceae bacterium]
MPELPEVETIRRSLEDIQGARIIRLQINRMDIIRQQEFEPQSICGERIAEVKRRGKFLALQLNKKQFLILHMGMTGRLYLAEEDAVLTEPHVHFIVHLDSGLKMIYQDARRFGGIWFIRDYDQFFAAMGPEPLSRQFNPAYLAEILKDRKAPVKNLLLDQHLIAGIGNIYADESLFAARIRPDRQAKTLTPDEVKRLCRAIKAVLKNSIQQRGTTFRDYRDGYNQKGGFQNFLKVYGKKNQPCPICGKILQVIRIGGRSSHFCESCQQ